MPLLHQPSHNSAIAKCPYKEKVKCLLCTQASIDADTKLHDKTNIAKCSAHVQSTTINKA